MTDLIHRVELTSAELLHLDGLVGAKTQRLIDMVKMSNGLHQLSPSEALMVAKIVDEARANGRLTFANVPISECPCCGHAKGYYPVRRSTKWKTKGRPDYDNPIMTGAWDLSRQCVVFKGRIQVGFCTECRPRVEPFVVAALKEVKVATDPRWKECPHLYEYFENCKCSSCGWSGHKGELGLVPSLMGGSYRGRCPQCKVCNELFDHPIKDVKGFTLVPVSAERARD